MDYYRDGRKMLTEYLQIKEYHQYPIATNEKGEPLLEVYFEIPLNDAGDVRASGIIDRIDLVSEDTIRILDYKTGFVPLAKEELDKDEQLTIYNLAVNHCYPQWPNVRLALLYLRHGLLETTRSPEEIEAVRHLFINTFYQIKFNDDPQPQLNSYCGYCPIKHNCPEYKKLTKDELILLGDFPDAPSLLWDELGDIKTKIKILNDYRKEIEDALTRQVQGADGGYIVIGNKKLKLVPQKRSYYPYEQVRKILGDDKVAQIASITKKDVESLIEDNDEIKEQLEQILVTYYTNPSLKTENI